MKNQLSKHARILKLFKEQRRLTQKDLNRISMRYGAIIHELRKEGNEIVTIPINHQTGHFEYQYKRGPAKQEDMAMEYEVLDEPKSNFFTRRMKGVK